MKLYRLRTIGLGEFYVIALHPTDAELALLHILQSQDYGTSAQREVTSIEYIAKASNSTSGSLKDNRLIISTPE